MPKDDVVEIAMELCGNIRAEIECYRGEDAERERADERGETEQYGHGLDKEKTAIEKAEGLWRSEGIRG